jgi:hypothetical protein
MSQTSSALTSRLTKFARGQGDNTRRMYALGRRVLHLRSYWTRRRVAQAMQPAAHVAIDDAKGFRIFSDKTFAEAQEGARASRQLLANRREALKRRRKARSSKQFLVNLLPPESVTPEHPLLRLAVRPDLLESVIAYLGTVPVLRSVQVFYSGSMTHEPISSQLYHCDADDVRQLKIFLLCNEVRHENGPLTILDADSSDRVRRATRYVYNDRLSDADVASVLDNPAPVELVGRPGTMCLVDTSRCFHYGSRVEPGAGPRLVAMVQYLSPFAFVTSGRRRATFADLIRDTHSPVQRAVLSGDDQYL